MHVTNTVLIKLERQTFRPVQLFAKVSYYQCYKLVMFPTNLTKSFKTE